MANAPMSYTSGANRTGQRSNDMSRRSVELKQEFLHALGQITSNGCIGFLDGLDADLNPGLHVDGVGNIDLPLTESDAQKLISKAQQAPYGKGSETLVDTTVRNTWQLDASQFKFTDPSWEEFMNGLCKTVAEKLGVGTDIRAEVYKMLIYEKGAMFKAHTE
jgi:hypothetical protein